jgi:hypothetical protein
VAFVVAVLAAALGYGVMNLLTATPLAMGHGSFRRGGGIRHRVARDRNIRASFSRHLIRRFGVLRIMAAGVASIFCAWALRCPAMK